MEVKLATGTEKRRIIKAYPYTKKYLNRKGTLYLAVEGDRFPGFAFVQRRGLFHEPTRTEALILLIEVFDESDRCKGIASALLGRVRQDAAADGCYQMIAYYQAGNLASHKLWVKNGFGIAAVKESDGKIQGCYAVCKL